MISNALLGDPERLGRQVGIIVHGQEHQLGTRDFLSKLNRRIEPVQKRHGNIQNHNIWLEPGSLLEQGAPVGHRSYDSAVGLQELSEGVQQERMIIGQEDAGAFHSAPPTERLLSR